MSEIYTCCCGNIFEDEDMIETCIVNGHDLDLNEFNLLWASV